MTNGVLRGLSGLTKLNTLHIADAYRVTNAGLEFISHLTGSHSLLLKFCAGGMPMYLQSTARKQGWVLVSTSDNRLISAFLRCCVFFYGPPFSIQSMGSAQPH